MTGDWRALIAGERMELDGEFADRVQASSLSSQQWNLVMTAVEFEIEAPETPADATLVADTGNLPAVADELDRVEDAGPGQPSGSNEEGLLSRILGAFAGGGGGEDERLAEAEALTEEYADRLQEKVIERGRWEAVCERAASG